MPRKLNLKFMKSKIFTKLYFMVNKFSYYSRRTDG